MLEAVLALASYCEGGRAALGHGLWARIANLLRLTHSNDDNLRPHFFKRKSHFLGYKFISCACTLPPTGGVSCVLFPPYSAIYSNFVRTQWGFVFTTL